MSCGPFWGTKCWRILTIIIAILLLVWSITTMISAYLSGSPLWWYQSTIVIYAIALFGLVLLIKEGLDALNNAVKYGIHPNKEDWESDEVPSTPYSQPSEPVRTYDNDEYE
jgi:hypothetical protein